MPLQRLKFPDSIFDYILTESSLSAAPVSSTLYSLPDGRKRLQNQTDTVQMFTHKLLLYVPEFQIRFLSLM